ncbi:hypothetical protein FNV43_RR26347 [Rhamnella rubrinervis]|uniref:O-methyltransferase domain-containing protein n=1 Tax=Rhamnella rubrinervis TaxID=2594499 RepID=A0A8K0DJJ3_9ROSA|nr:hypothetical protein FNV43_RR26347 [Rhamnella rubrinervis]
MASSLELQEENFSYAMQLVSSSALSMSLKCAIDLGVFDIIAKAGKFKLEDRVVKGYYLAPKSYFYTTKEGKNVLKYKGPAKNQVDTQGFDEPNIKRLVDVGGGFGVTLNLITETNPHIKAINFDLPNVVQHALYYPGVEHVGGNMFAGAPRGDAIFMKWILHDWSDEKCTELLKNCYKAIPENGKGIVIEAVVPIMPETSGAAKSIGHRNAFMMTQHRGGKERSKQKFLSLATCAGFSGIRFQCYGLIVPLLSVVTFEKNGCVTSTLVGIRA